MTLCALADQSGSGRSLGTLGSSKAPRPVPKTLTGIFELRGPSSGFVSQPLTLAPHSSELLGKEERNPTGHDVVLALDSL